MGKKGGLSTGDKSGGERAEEEDIPIDESKYTKKGWCRKSDEGVCLFDEEDSVMFSILYVCL